ncbi:hypothetical protein [Oceanihabitans sp. 2_MG-2023]|uniref:hypothetical protein n=1 Tax=Oceanihabitans sp. 2_MG-2023 TaxID=3062661 RepID=UPI0026E229D1|nr:hypothetical protein [Oceanihabitans sp. 2_MG-2023]
MKNYIYKFAFISMFFLVFSSCSTNNNSVSRAAESIEIIIDNGIPQNYSYNIIAKDYPMTPTSGYNCEFTITSEDLSANTFIANLGMQVATCPFTVTAPFSNTMTGSLSPFFIIPGINFDDAAANSINFNIIAFGDNPGDDIDIVLSGTFYVVSDPNPHTLLITIHVHRD